MIKRDQLIKFLENYFGTDLIVKARQKDECANGIQILGSENISKIVLGVSLNEEFLKEAARLKAQFCIFHHGFDIRTYKSLYPLFSQKRLKLIFDNQLTIAGFHYVLDVHPQIGNNAVIIKKLGAKISESLFDEWGYTAVFSQKQEAGKLAIECSRLFSHDVFAVYSGPEKVKKIGVVSGAGKPSAIELAEMEAKKVELFITGESAESIPHKMKESGINYFAAGHYATEVFGVKELGKVIKKEFKDRLGVEFLDIPNSL